MDSLHSRSLEGEVTDVFWQMELGWYIFCGMWRRSLTPWHHKRARQWYGVGIVSDSTAAQVETSKIPVLQWNSGCAHEIHARCQAGSGCCHQDCGISMFKGTCKFCQQSSNLYSIRLLGRLRFCHVGVAVHQWSPKLQSSHRDAAFALSFLPLHQCPYCYPSASQHCCYTCRDSAVRIWALKPQNCSRLPCQSISCLTQWK